MSDPKVTGKAVPTGDMKGGSNIKTPPKPTGTGQSKPSTDDQFKK